ncbi:hypothetical protein GCM10007175_14380 [Pseudarthrobacter scleromae]|uniref:Uncharacterized protein n=2 Tax=Pseudarthrobacter scleromae TaxID=158897 RepID=A0ABQ2CCM4_9MICC|nr:hypothetical protein GCM10007175_14380 [Pseudarthrobacter scleromae]
MFPQAAAHPANKLDAMERPQLEDSPAEIEVLEGQTSVEELLADLGFEWRHSTPAHDAAPATAGGEAFGQPALF